LLPRVKCDRAIETKNESDREISSKEDTHSDARLRRTLHMTLRLVLPNMLARFPVDERMLNPSLLSTALPHIHDIVEQQTRQQLKRFAARS
jgi:hypothetical protein